MDLEVIKTIFKRPMKQRPKLFVASSSEAYRKGVLKELVKLLRRELKHIEIVPWTQYHRDNLENVLKSLRTHLVEYAYAVFLAFPDDQIEISGEKMYTARDNVIFEFGMFLSQLGVNRTFLVTPHKKIPPHNYPFRILSDVGDSIRLGSYTIQKITARKALVRFRLASLVNKIKDVERSLAKDRSSAQRELLARISHLTADLHQEDRNDSFYLGKLRESIEELTRLKALACEKSVCATARDLPLYFKNFPDICDIRQLAEIQSYKKGLRKVWVFAAGPIEFQAGNYTEFSMLRETILDNLEHNVDYVYFVPCGFNTDDVNQLLSQRKNLTPARLKKMKSHISIVKVDSRLFKTYFTLHFEQNHNNPSSVYMSSVMKDRRDILIQVSDPHHEEQIFKCIRALGKHAYDQSDVSVLDLVTA